MCMVYPCLLEKVFVRKSVC